MFQFCKESNNLYNLNSFKYSGLANKKTVTVQPSGKDLSVVLATTKSKKQNKPGKSLHKSVMNKEFPRLAKAVANQFFMEPATSTSISGSKDLLDLEQKKNPTSSIDSPFLIYKNNNASLQTSKPRIGKLVTTPLPKSQVLGKLKDFLGVMAEANTRLQLDVKENSSIDYDIEALTGNETEYIEMDLALGIADLHTPEAVAAAESAMARSQAVISLGGVCRSDSDTESSECDDANVDEDDDDKNVNVKRRQILQASLKKSPQEKDVLLNDGQPRKRRKLVEIL